MDWQTAQGALVLLLCDNTWHTSVLSLFTQTNDIKFTNDNITNDF